MGSFLADQKDVGHLASMSRFSTGRNVDDVDCMKFPGKRSAWVCEMHGFRPDSPVKPERFSQESCQIFNKIHRRSSYINWNTVE